MPVLVRLKSLPEDEGQRKRQLLCLAMMDVLLKLRKLGSELKVPIERGHAALIRAASARSHIPVRARSHMSMIAMQSMAVSASV